MTNTGAPSNPPPLPPRPSYQHRRLLRFPDHGPLGGVCAGVADYLSVDPTIVRLAAVVLAVTGPGIPAYLVAWLLVPAADGTVVAPWTYGSHRRRDQVGMVFGVALITIALLVLWSHSWWHPASGWFVPVTLIAVGAWLLLRQRDDDAAPPPPIPPAPPTGPGGPSSPWQATPPAPPTSVVPVPDAPPTGTTEPTDASSTTNTPEVTDVLDSPTTETTEPGAEPDTEPTTTAFAPGDLSWGPTPPVGGDTLVAGAPPPFDAPLHATRRRRVLGPVVFGVLLLWGGIAWLAGVSATTGLAIGLCIVGAGFVVGAFTGGSRALILPALLIAAALAFATTVHIPLSGGIGDRRDQVTSMHDLRHSYKLAIGQRVLDLRDLPLPDKTTDVTIRQGIGHLSVIVPDGVNVLVDSKADIGSVELFDHQEGGTNVQITQTHDGFATRRRLHLHLTLGIGRIDVHTATPDAGQITEGGPTPTSVPDKPTKPETPATAVAHA